ncbi:hypothetical protein CDL12_19571 [Handroanthus impetiginosus]|uniref:Uncharacterized protein n=1 Tax=Handroanthus impetiginosus TaxID=429701 RepID=A0A2G9GS69_9LAMI|nr:hypothetical protein CDL12_19571 [Handroanthus impetiginosus]
MNAPFKLNRYGQEHKPSNMLKGKTPVQQHIIKTYAHLNMRNVRQHDDICNMGKIRKDMYLVIQKKHQTSHFTIT